MEKTVDIGGKSVKLISDAMLPLIYRREFNEDIFVAQSTVFGVAGGMINPDEDAEIAINYSDLGKIDSLGLMQITWAMAKRADKSIAGFEGWLEGFESFPVMDIFADIVTLYLQNITGTSTIKNATAVVDS